MTPVHDLLHAATAAAARPVRPGHAPVPAAPGAVALIAHRGRIRTHAAAGHAVLFAPDGALLPAAERRPIGPDDAFDLASLTKLFTAVAALVQVEAGTLDLDAPVHRYLPEFGGSGARAQVTARGLLSHTSGLPAALPLWRVAGGRAERVRRVLAEPLEREPGASHVYSCVGYLVLGLLLECLTGLAMPALLAATVTGPLGMASTGYAAGGAVAATEYQRDPPRGLVRGSVHDEAAWALTGAGNAGVFGTARDLLTFAEAVRTGSPGGGPALLGDGTRALLRTDVLTAPQRARAGYGQALGFRIGDPSFMAMPAAALIGHTGFTGTSLVIDLRQELVVVLLTNRVHPVRTAFDVGPLRQAVVRAARG